MVLPFPEGRGISALCPKQARALNGSAKPLQHDVHLVVRMLSWGAPRATLPVFTGGDTAVVRGVGADRGMRMGH
jgi:hypothetical protein